MPPKICIFTGPMFAGKTTKIIECWMETYLPKFAFKFSSDLRYESDNQERQIISHNENKLPAISISKCAEITNHIPIDEPQIVVFIDEGQFLTDIYQWILDYAPANITKIFISGLDYDIFGNKFSTEFSNLIEAADECHTLTAKCYKCQEPATFTQFIDHNSLSKINGNVLIGGSEQYQPACYKHFTPITN
jgi:thymidine kinase